MRVVEIVKEQIIERTVPVPAPGSSARLSIPPGIAATWRELLPHIARLTEREIRVAPPFGTEPASVVYSDRYLRSEKALRSLNLLLHALGARTDTVPTQVMTLPPDQAGMGLRGDFRSASELAAAWNRLGSGRKGILLRDVPHARTLNIQYRDGPHWLIDLDEGVTVFQDHSRGTSNRGFLCHVTLVRPTGSSARG